MIVSWAEKEARLRRGGGGRLDFWRHELRRPIDRVGARAGDIAEQNGPRFWSGGRTRARSIGAPSAWLSLAGLRRPQSPAPFHQARDSIPHRAVPRARKEARRRSTEVHRRLCRSPSALWLGGTRESRTVQRSLEGSGGARPGAISHEADSTGRPPGRPRPVQQLGATPAIIRAEPRDPIESARRPEQEVKTSGEKRAESQGDGPIVRRTPLPPHGFTTASPKTADLTVQ